MEYKISDHARKRIADMKITEADVLKLCRSSRRKTTDGDGVTTRHQGYVTPTTAALADTRVPGKAFEVAVRVIVAPNIDGTSAVIKTVLYGHDGTTPGHGLAGRRSSLTGRNQGHRQCDARHQTKVGPVRCSFHEGHAGTHRVAHYEW